MPRSSSNRIRLDLVLVTVIALAFWQSAHAQVVTFGAGNVSGWNVAATQAMPAQLQSMLNANGYAVRVLNAGIHDDTTTDMRNRLDQDIPPGTKIVILDMTGGVYNDPVKGISPQQGKANLQAITARLRARGITVIAVNFGDFPTAPRQPDGRHLTAEGNKYVAAQLLPQVMQALGPPSADQPATADVRTACRADAQRLCASVMRDETQRRACMHDHRTELSKDCLTAIIRSRQGG